MVHPSWTAGIEVTPSAIVYPAIAIHIANLLSIAKDGALASANYHFGTAVTIEISHGKG